MDNALEQARAAVPGWVTWVALPVCAVWALVVGLLGAAVAAGFGLLLVRRTSGVPWVERARAIWPARVLLTMCAFVAVPAAAAGGASVGPLSRIDGGVMVLVATVAAALPVLATVGRCHEADWWLSETALRRDRWGGHGTSHLSADIEGVAAGCGGGGAWLAPPRKRR